MAGWILMWSLRRMESSRKLIRGLKDISPLFTDPGAPSPKRTAEIQVLSISSPHNDSDSLLLNTYFASRLASPEKPCSLISLLSRTANICPWQSEIRKTEPFGRNIKRHSLFWDEVEEVLLAGPGKRRAALKDRNIFLDFEYRHLLYFPKILSLLDKWVLLLKPTPESLIEGYKMLKAGLMLNPWMECFMLLETKADPPYDSSIFEKFAALVSRNLKVNLGWLGWLNLSDPTRFFAAELNMDQIHFQPFRIKMSLEKLILASWLEADEEPAEVMSSGKGGRV